MKVKEIMTTILEEQNVSMAQLGRAVGIEDKKASDLTRKRINQKNISVNVLSEMLAAVGYTLVVVPTGPKLKDGEYEVTIDG
jgi:predicted XRE-type DNA-binding protein